MKRIAFITDIHLNEQFPIDNNVDAKVNWERIIEDIKAKNINDIVFGGDIGESTAHEWFFETLKPYNLKLILGNHDRFQEVSKFYHKGNGKNELYYQFKDNNDQYLFLDTSSEGISDNQLEWLKEELQPNTRILLFVHHPIIKVDTPADKLYPLKNRDELKLILKTKAKEVVVFCGHYHMNDEIVEDNIRQIITKASSFQMVKFADDVVIDNSTFGYRIIEIDEQNITTKLVNFESKVNTESKD